MSTGYPRNLSYFVRKLAGYSRNTFKLQTLNQDTASPSQIITVDLPNNSLVDLNTLTWFFTGSTVGTGGTAQFPRNIESIIERLELEINGQLVSGGCSGYNQLWNIIADTSLGEDCTNRRKILQGSTDVPVAGSIANQTNVQFAITNWLGPLGSMKPEVLDTNLLGNVRLRITLAPTSILTFGTNTTAATYSLGNMFFSCDTISIDDGNFYAMHDQFLSSGGVYEIPFNNYFSFAQSATGSGALKFSLSTQSLNMVWATFANAGFTGSTGRDADAATSVHFKRTGNGISGYQFNINNVPYPNYRPTAVQAYQLLQNAYGMSQDTLGGCHRLLDTPAKWTDSFWVAAQSFAHNTSDDERYISGIDTRGNVAQCYFEYQGLAPANQTGLIFCQTTSLLRIGAGRQIEVVM
jgi:hypothetical protein